MVVVVDFNSAVGFSYGLFFAIGVVSMRCVRCRVDVMCFSVGRRGCCVFLGVALGLLYCLYVLCWFHFSVCVCVCVCVCVRVSVCACVCVLRLSSFVCFSEF